MLEVSAYFLLYAAIIMFIFCAFCGHIGYRQPWETHPGAFREIYVEINSFRGDFGKGTHFQARRSPTSCPPSQILWFPTILHTCMHTLA